MFKKNIPFWIIFVVLGIVFLDLVFFGLFIYPKKVDIKTTLDVKKEKIVKSEGKTGYYKGLFGVYFQEEKCSSATFIDISFGKVCEPLGFVLLKNADPKTFKVIIDGVYGKDKNSVYYRSQKLSQADPETFKTIKNPRYEFYTPLNSEIYSKDNYFVFLKENIISGADPKTFEIIVNHEELARDKSKVYHSYMPYPDYGPNFRSLYSGDWRYYKLDDHHVYYGFQNIEGRDPFYFIEGADPFTLKSIDCVDISMEKTVNCDQNYDSSETGGIRFYGGGNAFNYVKDKKRVYHEDTVIDGADPSSFVLINKSKYARDNHQMYYYHSGTISPIINSDPLSFQIIGDDFARDNHRLYFLGKEIKYADPLSFEFLNYYFTRDNNHVYFEGSEIESADPKTFKIVEIKGGQYPGYFAKDSRHVYFKAKTIQGADPNTFEAIDYVHGKDKSTTYDTDKLE